MAHPQRRRDEAVRTATFGASAMIYAARSLGLGSTPMIGFDAEAVHREFGLADDEVPVMLLSIARSVRELGAKAAPSRGRCAGARLMISRTGDVREQVADSAIAFVKPLEKAA